MFSCGQQVVTILFIRELIVTQLTHRFNGRNRLHWNKVNRQKCASAIVPACTAILAHFCAILLTPTFSRVSQ
jgi:hypothetical protein